VAADQAGLDAGTDGFDDAGSFITQAGGETRLFEVLAAGVEGLGPVEADGLDTDAEFAGFGLARRLVFKFESRGTGELMEAYNLGHGVLLCHWMGA
jgi:hypothetical protein